MMQPRSLVPMGRPSAGGDGPSRLPLIGAVVLGLVAVGAFALSALDLGGDEGLGQEGTAEVTQRAVAADVDVEGEPLPAYEGPEADEAVGMSAPAVHGTGLDGEPLAITPGDGTLRAVLFVAHWCPVCADEMDSVQDALADGDLPDDVQVMGVSTGVREDEPNFPPGAWFAEESWAVPTLIDNVDRHAAGAYGLVSYPYWVFIDGDGIVAGRLAGTLAGEDLQQLLEELSERG